MKASLWLLGCCWVLVTARAALYSPRILSPHTADTYSLKTFAGFDRWRDLSGDAKVFEVYRYLTDPRTGLYPMGVPAREGPEDLPEYGAVTDPGKMLNVYPIGHCGTLGPAAAGILEGMGIGPARTLIIPGWHHVAAEAFYHGSWHYVDLDVRAVFRRENGTLASMAEARADPSLWLGPNRPWFFPLDDLGSVQRAYASRPAEHRYGVASGGHTKDFVLRQGEVFTRWWKPQGGRWNHHPSYAEAPFPRDVIEREPRGPKSKHESFSIHTHGNGRFVYRPNLTSQSTDFDDGVYEAQNVEAGESGLTLSMPGPGHAIFEVRTPYVIVPLVGDLDTTADDREASVVKVDATGVKLALSLDNGLTWEPLAESTDTFDLTQQVTGRYGYLLRLEFRGQPGEAVVRALEMATWVQLHPASLPSLRRGVNRMRLVTGDHYDLPTRVVSVCPDAGDREAFLSHLVAPPDDYDPARRTGRIRGSFVVKVPAPPGTKIAWFTAGASFAAAVGATQNTRNAIAFAASESGEFRDLYRANVPPDQSHWHYNVDREVKLDRPADAVWVRYTGHPAVNTVRIVAHCLEDLPRAAAPLVVTQGWSENGVRRRTGVNLTGPGEYEIETGEDPQDEFIELAVPTGARPANQPAGTGSRATGARPGAEGEAASASPIQPPAQPWFPRAPVLPAPRGEVIRVGTVEELFAAVDAVEPGGTVLVGAGRYWLPRCLQLRTDDVTLRGASGDRTQVILDGARSRDGELVALSGCSGVTIADLTIQNVRHNGIKINSDSNVQRVTIYNCILHNIWQRAVKGVKVPLDQLERMRPKDCRIQYCLFYNDRPKRFSDDPADTAENFGGNYVGGIDVMYAQGWTISDNVFVGIQGRTRQARGAVFLWHETEDCVVERNIIIDCDTGIALGNSHKPPEVPVHATRCVVRDNFITRAPENGIVADFTRDCRVVGNTIHDPTNRLGRLIRLVHDNEGLVVADNVLSGPPLRNESTSRITLRNNRVGDWTEDFRDAGAGDLRRKVPPLEPAGPGSTPADSQTGRDAFEAPHLWEYSAPLISPEVREREPSRAQKDPSVVFHAGRWHVFMTVKLPGRSAIEYCSFTRWEEAQASARTILRVSDSDYYCAPQVFYFRPHDRWYLVYQMGVPGSEKMWVAYSTTTDIANPGSWTRAAPILDGGRDDPRPVGGLDYWIICDTQRAYLFLTSLDGRMWRLWTRLQDFPSGFGQCELALQAGVFEASHTYRLKGLDRYLTIIEENGRRYFKAYLADRLDGEWRPLADTPEHPFAGWNNIRPAPGVEPWTDNVSHGELIRDGSDETLTVDPGNLRFLFQGMWDRDKAGNAYGQFQWRLGLLTPIAVSDVREYAPPRDP